MESITIEGLVDVQELLKDIESKVEAMKEIILKRFMEEVAVIAKENCPKDTGALQYSIHTEILEATLKKVEGAVIAGDPNVIRGEGEFTESHWTTLGLPPSKMPTSEYAGLVEEKAGYMETAYQWALANIDRFYEIALAKILA